MNFLKTIFSTVRQGTHKPGFGYLVPPLFSNRVAQRFPPSQQKKRLFRARVLVVDDNGFVANLPVVSWHQIQVKLIQISIE